MNALPYVATLISAGDEALPLDLVAKATLALEEKGGRSITLKWHERAKALDLAFSHPEIDLAALTTALRLALGPTPVDVVVQPTLHRRKRLLIADMESTVIEQEMLDELAEAIGQREQVAFITARAMNGEIDFAAALRERVALLKGQPAALLDTMCGRITEMPGAAALVAAMKATGARCWLVSGGFTCFAEPVARRLGFDLFQANKLVIKDGLLTGEVAEPISGRDQKRALLAQACADLDILPAETIAIGDGANDIPMLQAAGLGIAYHGKPVVRQAVAQQINHGDLSALFYVQDLAAKTALISSSRT